MILAWSCIVGVIGPEKDSVYFDLFLELVQYDENSKENLTMPWGYPF